MVLSFKTKWNLFQNRKSSWNSFLGKIFCIKYQCFTKQSNPFSDINSRLLIRCLYEKESVILLRNYCALKAEEKFLHLTSRHFFCLAWNPIILLQDQGVHYYWSVVHLCICILVHWSLGQLHLSIPMSTTTLSPLYFPVKDVSLRFPSIQEIHIPSKDLILDMFPFSSLKS